MPMQETERVEFVGKIKQLLCFSENSPFFFHCLFCCPQKYESLHTQKGEILILTR